LIPRAGCSWPGYVFTGDLLHLPAGHFGFGYGGHAHSSDEFYVINSANAQVHGLDGAVYSFAEYLYELADLT